MAKRLRSRRPQHYQREINLGRVMRALRYGGPASRSELADTLGLDRSTLTHIAATLLDAGLIVPGERAEAAAAGGRRPQILKINPDGFGALGLDIRDHDAEWVFLRLDGSEHSRGAVSRAEIAQDRDGRKWLEYVGACAAGEVASLRRRGVGEVLGVGMSLPGVVDRDVSVLRSSIALDLQGVELESVFGQFGANVIVENDANCALWNIIEDPRSPANIVLAHIRLHRDAGGSFLPSGSGVGLAIAIDHRIYYGSRGQAGEVRGHGWSQEDSDQFGLRLDRIQADSGDELALRTLARTVLEAMSVVASSIDPDIVVMTGEPMNGIIHEVLSTELHGSYMWTVAQRGALQVASDSNRPAADGAARMVLAREFSIPESNGSDRPGWQRIIDERRVASPVR